MLTSVKTSDLLVILNKSESYDIIEELTFGFLIIFVTF